MASSTGASIRGGPNGLVLVVDDYEPGLYSKCRALTEGGFTVLPAKTGADALELVARDHPGVVVLDVRLPDTDGVTVCRSIKRDPATAATMVLQVSAYYTSTSDQVLGLDSGADSYIPGDIAPSLLVAAVRALFRTRAAEQAVRESVARLQLERQLRALTARLLTTQDDERSRIARELHAGVCQRLALAQIVATQLRERGHDFTPELDQVIGEISGSLEELRNLTHTLHPSGIEQLGLDAGLRTLCEDVETTYGLATRYIRSAPDRAIPASVTLALYRIAQEGLQNTAKHVGDARVVVTLSGDDTDLSLTIEDDGQGFDVRAAYGIGGLGLVSMNERAKLIGGQLDVVSTPGVGTTIKIVVPWRDTRKASAPVVDSTE